MVPSKLLAMAYTGFSVKDVGNGLLAKIVAIAYIGVNVKDNGNSLPCSPIVSGSSFICGQILL